MEILGEHIRMLIIFVRNIFSDSIGEDDMLSPAEREEQDVAVSRQSIFPRKIRMRDSRCHIGHCVRIQEELCRGKCCGQHHHQRVHQ